MVSHNDDPAPPGSPQNRSSSVLNRPPSVSKERRAERTRRAQLRAARRVIARLRAELIAERKRQAELIAEHELQAELIAKHYGHSR